MKTTTRRGAMAAMAAAATVVASQTAYATDDTLRTGVQTIIADIRALPGSTPYCVYVALQDVGDKLERIAGGAP